ncbi:MAG TPA: sialidase family protein [Bryobacteraceae bacterium]|nr:sialidase family protein [Bryobacteraceae bacterium]
MPNRREFFGACVWGVAAHASALPGVSQTAGIQQVEHIKMHGDRTTYCGHPRQGGIFNFGNNEIAVLHNHAPCAYEKRADIQHDYGGYHSRSSVLLQRSLDGGRTWPGKEEVEVWNEAAPVEDRRKFLLSAFTSPRETIDLSTPQAAVMFPRTFLGPIRYGAYEMISFALRSQDKGRTWEKVPTLLTPPPGCYSATPDNTPIVRLPDNTYLFPMRTFGGRDGVDLYGSSDNGLSWQYRTHICEPHDYPALVLLRSGRLQCYNYPLGMCYSDDGGKTWSKRKLIAPPGPSPWLPQDPFYGDELSHRSPTPLVLRDGRIVVLFARRISARRGMGLIVSEDGGKSWGRDIILRDDASVFQRTKVRGVSTEYSDIGYPVATELDDGQIFASYYFMVNDGTNFGGSRFLAGSSFKLS